MKKSADYYETEYMFRQMIKDENSTVVHNYADLVWLNIAWFQDSEKPFVSSLNSAFYEGDNIYKSESLIKAVYDGVNADKSYSRYWHGSLLFIKPLLIVTDISGIRKINIAVCVLLVLVLSAMLIKRRLYVPFIGYLVSLVMIFAYIIPLCMEYMPAFALMHIASILILAYGDRMSKDTLCTFFAFVGALICFFDFLTNEIITLFMPMIFLICMNNTPKSKNQIKNQSKFKSEDVKFGDLVVYAAMWLVGYVMTWAVKWFMCFLMFGKESFVQTLSDGTYRMAGVVPQIEQNQVTGAIVKNINRLFPLNFLQNESDVWLALFVFVFVSACIFFLYRRENIPKKVWFLFLIACSPYVRYAILSNHSCLHPFFTFRTQIITVTAVFSAFGTGLEREGGEGGKCGKNPKTKLPKKS